MTPEEKHTTEAEVFTNWMFDNWKCHRDIFAFLEMHLKGAGESPVDEPRETVVSTRKEFQRQRPAWLLLKVLITLKFFSRIEKAPDLKVFFHPLCRNKADSFGSLSHDRVRATEFHTKTHRPPVPPLPGSLPQPPARGHTLHAPAVPSIKFCLSTYYPKKPLMLSSCVSPGRLQRPQGRGSLCVCQ